MLDPEAAALRPGRELTQEEIQTLQPGDLVFRTIYGGPAYLQRVAERQGQAIFARAWYHPERGWLTGATTLTGRCRVFTAQREPFP